MGMTKHSVGPNNAIEMQEVMQKIRDAGYAELLDCLLEHEKECFTKKGRINKSSTCRILGWKAKKLEDAFKFLKDLLKMEFDFED
jgi:hypothetical protein